MTAEIIFLYLLTLRRFANSLASLFTDPLVSLESPSSAGNLLTASARGARSLSQEAKKARLHIEFYTEIVERSDILKWNDLAWGDLTMDRSDRKPK